MHIFKIIFYQRTIFNKKVNHKRFFANTIFQDNKLPLFKLILGIYLFFTNTKGMTAVELSDELDINYKTACLFANKCRYLMTLSNARYTLNSLFYEGDVFSIGKRSAGHPGKSS